MLTLSWSHFDINSQCNWSLGLKNFFRYYYLTYTPVHDSLVSLHPLLSCPWDNLEPSNTIKPQLSIMILKCSVILMYKIYIYICQCKYFPCCFFQQKKQHLQVSLHHQQRRPRLIMKQQKQQQRPTTSPLKIQNQQP